MYLVSSAWTRAFSRANEAAGWELSMMMPWLASASKAAWSSSNRACRVGTGLRGTTGRACHEATFSGALQRSSGGVQCRISDGMLLAVPERGGPGYRRVSSRSKP